MNEDVVHNPNETDNDKIKAYELARRRESDERKAQKNQGSGKR